MQTHAKRADQGGHTLSELLIGIVVATIFAPVVIGIFAIAFGLLRFTDRAPTEVSYLITGELSRSAALVVPQQSCVNPEFEDRYEDCVEAASLPLVPFEDSDTSPSPLGNSDSPDPICWLALSGTQLHTRVKQCWAHDPTTEQLNISLYLPSNPTAQGLLAIEQWEPNPDSTTSAATGIEAWGWELHPDDSGNVVLVQIDVCASLTDEERGRPHLTELPRCGPAFSPDPACIPASDLDGCDPVGIHLPPIFVTPGTA